MTDKSVLLPRGGKDEAVFQRATTLYEAAQPWLDISAQERSSQ